MRETERDREAVSSFKYTFNNCKFGSVVKVALNFVSPTRVNTFFLPKVTIENLKSTSLKGHWQELRIALSSINLM